MSAKEPPAMARDKAVKTSSKKEHSSTRPAKPSKPTKSKPKSAGLSEERIVDSDSDSNNEAAPTSTTKKPAPNFSKESALKSTSKKESTKKSKALSPPSSDSDHTTSEQQEVAEVVHKKPNGVPAKVNGVKRKAEEEESSSEGTTGSDSEEEAEKPQAKKAKTTPAETASPSPSSSDDEASSEESEADNPAAATNGHPSKDTRPAPAQRQQSSLQSIPAQPFEAPPGYSSWDVDGLDADSHLSKKGLGSKQIWYITAPLNVPIKSISEVALDGISNGTPALNFKDVEYVLNEDKSYDTQFLNVLLPANPGYQDAGQNVDRTLRLQQKIVLPNLSKTQADINTGSDAAAYIAQASVNDIRPQPKGLKMRYKPPGFGKGDPGMMSGSSEDEAGHATSGAFQFPRALGAHGAPGADEPATAITERSRKKDKKSRKSEHVADGDEDTVNGEAMALAQKKKKKQQEEGGKRVAKENEGRREKEESTGQERARIREQKRAKKEAKRSA